MATLIDIYGNPLRSEVLSEPQSESAHVAHLHREFAGHPSRNLTPVKLARILETAELGNLQGQSELFMDMEERDAHLFAEVSKRKRVLAPIPYRIEPPRNPSAKEKADAEYLAEAIGDIEGWEELLIDMADGIGHGFSPIEFEWAKLGKERIIRKFHHRPQTWFQLPTGNQDELRLRGSSNGETLLPFGWMIHRPKARSGYVARTGLFRVLAWPYLFKHYSVRDLAELLEIYGLPIRLGKYPPGTADAEKASLMRAVIQLGHSAAGIIPEGMSIEFQKAAEGSEGPFLAMMRYCDDAISKAVLGGTLTSNTSESGGGAMALGNVHNEVRHDLKAADARQLAGTLSRDLLWPMLVLNRGGYDDPRRAPRLVFDTRDPAEVAQVATNIKTAVDLEIEVPLQWAREQLSIPEPQDGEPVLGGKKPQPQPPTTVVPPAPAAPTDNEEGGDGEDAGAKPPKGKAALAAQVGAKSLSEADQVAVDALIDALPAQRVQDQAEQLLKPVLAALHRGGDESELLGLLNEALPDVHSDDLQEALERMFFAIDVWARLHVNHELGIA